VEEKKQGNFFLKRVVLVNIEEGIWWQQLLGPRVKKSKERERGPPCPLFLSHSYCLKIKWGVCFFYGKKGKGARKMGVASFSPIIDNRINAGWKS